MRLFSSLGRDLGIDIGTFHTHIFVEGRGVVVSEPSIVATDAKQESVVTVGEDAHRLLLRNPETLAPMSPLKEGFIVDYRIVLSMLKYFMNKASKAVRRSRVVMAVPCGITDVERRAMTDAIIQAGAREAYLLESPVAAAIGANLPIMEARGSMAVDIGGSTTDVAIVSMGGKVASKTSRVGGNELNEAIYKYIRSEFSIMVSNETVEDIKLTLGTAMPPSVEREYTIVGRHSETGLTKRCIIRKSEIYEILRQPIAEMVAVVRSILEKTPPELVADIMESGMLLTGGTALLEGLDLHMREELGVPVRIADAPDLTVALGLGKAASDVERLERLLVASKLRKGRS